MKVYILYNRPHSTNSAAYGCFKCNIRLHLWSAPTSDLAMEKMADSISAGGATIDVGLSSWLPPDSAPPEDLTTPSSLFASPSPSSSRLILSNSPLLMYFLPCRKSIVGIFYLTPTNGDLPNKTLTFLFSKSLCYTIIPLFQYHWVPFSF